MKPGQIWSHKHPKTGVVTGLKVVSVHGLPGFRPICIFHKIKDPHKDRYSLVLHEDGLPMLKDGTSSKVYTLIEDVP